MIAAVVIGMLVIGLTIGGIGFTLVGEGRALEGVAASARLSVGVALLLLSAFVIVGTVGALIDPF